MTHLQRTTALANIAHAASTAATLIREATKGSQVDHGKLREALKLLGPIRDIALKVRGELEAEIDG